MQYRKLFAFFLGLAAYGVSLASEGITIEYVGSFSKKRSSQEHVYVSEVWLWSYDKNIVGLYLDKAGLQGGGLPVLTHKIIKGRLEPDGSLLLETKWYRFEGSYLGNLIEGKLVQGSEVIWGGIEGSDKIELVRGSNVNAIENPGYDIAELADLNKWIDALPGIQ